MSDSSHNDKPQVELKKKLWQQFKGKRNSKQILIEKAKALSFLAVFSINEVTKVLFQHLKNDEKQNKGLDKFDEVSLETAIFYLHFIDRESFSYLEAEERDIFMDAIFIEIREALSRVFKSGIEAMRFRSTFGSKYNERQVEYLRYKTLFGKKNESKKNTLFWEFAKKMADFFDSENGIFVMMWAMGIVNPLSQLQLPELFKD